MNLRAPTQLFTLLALLGSTAPLGAQGTAFTYQGRLDDGASPASGVYDLRFALFNAASAGLAQGSALTNAATAVSNGLFTVTLDFGNQFPGADRWLELAVRTNGNGAFTTLMPRQALTPTPYAITAGTVTGTISPGQLPANVITNGASGVNLSGSFTGNGGGLTNIPASAVVAAGSNYLDPSSTGSTISGGEFNRIEANAPYSVIAGGLSNSITTNVSFAIISGGQGALASVHGQTAHAAGSFVTKGDAQATEYILRGETVGAVTNAPLFLDGVSKRLTIKLKQTLVFDITVAARNATTLNAGYQIHAMAERTGSSVYLNGSTATPVDVPPIFEDVPGWKVQLRPNAANSSVDVEVTGSTGSTVRWVAVIRATEIFIP